MDTASTKNPMARVMALRDFRLLFAGASTSLLGDQFALIATPWLVLKLTGDPMALGIVLALEGVPRAIFMLLGGAITDRLSPRLVMLISDVIRFILTGLMALAVFTGTIQVWMLYAFSLGFGLVAGFAIPAENSIVPLLVEERDLQAGNSVMMGITQLVGFVGPSVAGVLIGGYSSSSLGIGLAYAIDALSFAVSAACLWSIRSGRAGEAAAKENLWASILAGVQYLWDDEALRLMVLVLSAVNFLLIGPLLVGIPVLADQRLPEGAVAFGMLMSAFAGGNLAGYLIAGSLPRPNGNVMRSILILLVAAFGIVIGSLGFILSTWVDFGLLLLLGLGNGYIAILLFTWMQTRTPKDMLGRMMSIMMFSNTGLVPISQAISGVVCKWNLTLLFVTAGALVVLVALWTALQPGIRVFSESSDGAVAGRLNFSAVARMQAFLGVVKNLANTIMSKPTLAIFDLDYTLLEGDCESLWAQFLVRQGVVGPAFAGEIDSFYRQYEAGNLDYRAYEEFFLRPLVDLPSEVLLGLREKYLAEIQSLLRPAMLEKVGWHREQGHVLLLITASDDFISRPISQILGFPNILCTLAETRDGKLTGKIGDHPPFREGKLYQLKIWLAERKMSLVGSWCYSDSYNDLPLLECADHPVAVTPDARLLEHARAHHWEVISA